MVFAIVRNAICAVLSAVFLGVVFLSLCSCSLQNWCPYKLNLCLLQYSTKQLDFINKWIQIWLICVMVCAGWSWASFRGWWPFWCLQCPGTDLLTFASCLYCILLSKLCSVSMSRFCWFIRCLYYFQSYFAISNHYKVLKCLIAHFIDGIV